MNESGTTANIDYDVANIPDPSKANPIPTTPEPPFSPANWQVVVGNTFQLIWSTSPRAASYQVIAYNWTGTSWAPLGAGLSNSDWTPTVTSLATYFGELVAAGEAATEGGRLTAPMPGKDQRKRRPQEEKRLRELAELPRNAARYLPEEISGCGATATWSNYA